MLRAMWRIALAATLALVADVRPADSCSCAYEPAEIWPVHGATGVPLNARITVRLSSTQNLTVTLRDGTGATVPLMFPPRPALPDWVEVAILVGTPSAALAPNTTYTITAQDQYRPDVVATFTTGTIEDNTPPAFTGIASLEPETMTYPLNGCYDSCVSASDGHLSRMRFDFPALPADVVFAELRTHGDNDVVVRQPLPASGAKAIGFSGGACDQRSPVLVPGGRYCARLIAYDVAGNAAGGDTEVCATAEICPPRSMFPHDSCTPSDGCGPDAGYDPFDQGDVDPKGPTDGGGCDASGGATWWTMALSMMAMSWVCARRRR